jgi:hypothetical protein
MNVTRPNREINRLLAAAIVSKNFCSMLIEDPIRAIDVGYLGEAFMLSVQEREMLGQIRAETLQDFAVQLMEGQKKIEAARNGAIENKGNVDYLPQELMAGG